MVVTWFKMDVRAGSVDGEVQQSPDGSPTDVTGAKFVVGSPEFGTAPPVRGMVIMSEADANDDDDDDYIGDSKTDRKLARRMAHTVAEQKRRDQIKRGYDELQAVVPTCHEQGPAAQKVSKAVVLHKAIEYITYLQQQNTHMEDELVQLRKEVTALQIMKSNYEQIAQAHKSQPPHGHHQVSDQTKFDLFQTIMDTQFQTFNSTVSVSHFDALSSSIFNWLEESCQPQISYCLKGGKLLVHFEGETTGCLKVMREITLAALRSLNLVYGPSR